MVGYRICVFSKSSSSIFHLQHWPIRRQPELRDTSQRRVTVAQEESVPTKSANDRSLVRLCQRQKENESRQQIW